MIYLKLIYLTIVAIVFGLLIEITSIFKNLFLANDSNHFTRG